jgi:hypothetical protein
MDVHNKWQQQPVMLDFFPPINSQILKSLKYNQNNQ